MNPLHSEAGIDAGGQPFFAVRRPTTSPQQLFLCLKQRPSATGPFVSGPPADDDAAGAGASFSAAGPSDLGTRPPPPPPLPPVPRAGGAAGAGALMDATGGPGWSDAAEEPPVVVVDAIGGSDAIVAEEPDLEVGGASLADAVEAFASSIFTYVTGLGGADSAHPAATMKRTTWWARRRSIPRDT